MGRVILAGTVVALLIVWVAAAPDTRPVASTPAPTPSKVVHRPVVHDEPNLRTLQAKYKALSKQLSSLKPSQPYILVDTARNRLYVKRQGEGGVGRYRVNRQWDHSRQTRRYRRPVDFRHTARRIPRPVEVDEADLDQT